MNTSTSTNADPHVKSPLPAQAGGGEFARGWFQTPEGARPAVCAVELVPKLTFTVNGRTDRP